MKKSLVVTFMLVFTLSNFGCSQRSEAVVFRGNLERTGLYDSNEKMTSGQLDWKLKVDNGWLSNPVISQGIVFVNGPGGNFYAVDAKSGESQWVFKRDKYVGSSPAISNHVVYVGGFDHFLYAVNAKSGVERWRYETGDMIISSPVVSDNTVYFGSYDGNLYALDANTGKEKWKYKTQGLDKPFNTSASPEYEVLGAISSSPALSNGVVYFSSFDGYLYALEANTGEEKWKFNTGDGLTSTPAISNEIIYFGDYKGYLYAIDNKGQLKWKLKTQDSALVSSATVSNGIVYFTSSLDGPEYKPQNDYYLYAVEAESSKVLWKSKLSAIVYWLTISNSVLYFGDKNGGVFALDAAKGKELWTFKAESAISSEIVIAEGKIFFCTDDGYLYALR